MEEGLSFLAYKMGVTLFMKMSKRRLGCMEPHGVEVAKQGEKHELGVRHL